MDPNVIALIRFSYLDDIGKAFRTLRDLTAAERSARVLAPERLAARFALFETVCLPSLAAQNPERFAAILVTSATLPDPFRDRLEALVADHPNLHVAYREPAGFRPVIAEEIARRICGPDAPRRLRLTLRLDDDDALAADYADRVQRYLVPAHEGWCLTFPRGFALDLSGPQPVHWNMHYPNLAAGLGYVGSEPWRHHIFHCGFHTRVSDRFPTIMDGAAPMYLITEHGFNDSDRKRSARAEPLTEAGVATLGDGRFAFLDLGRTEAALGQR